ncbi:AaceriAGL055Cp [[Ashbya] aceris (nom. inval.)]|nr:AaceriAGL055Cp [[Ashbya] aceris (nom. inval.)]
MGYEDLKKRVWDLLAQNIESNYRVAVVVVGHPGSGKSTIAQRLKNDLNQSFQSHLKARRGGLRISADIAAESLDESVPVASSALVEEARRGFFAHVEDLAFKPHKFYDGDGTAIIFGRGGLPNSVRIASEALDLTSSVNIAEVVPMDGFHLSRAHLDHFTDAVAAHKRRGAPWTFDSNNYLQLCKLLAATCMWKPAKAPKGDALLETICDTFAQCPVISYPGFDHAAKDPVRDQHVLTGFTRVLIFDGLYLLYDQENWAHIYQSLAGTGALLVVNVTANEATRETRVAARHLAAGLVGSVEEGVRKFRENDLLNAKLIEEHTLKGVPTITLCND